MEPDQIDSLAFRERPDRRPRRAPSSKSGAVWVVIAIIAALLFVLTIRALLQRTAWTAGASPATDVSASAADARDAEWREATPLQPVPAAMPMVYRCVDRAGAVSLQSQPCGPGQRTTRAVTAPPDVEPPRRPMEAPRARETSSHAYAFTGPSASDQARAQREANCEFARREREQTLERVGLRRTYDLLQRLDAMVAQACR